MKTLLICALSVFFLLCITSCNNEDDDSSIKNENEFTGKKEIYETYINGDQREYIVYKPSTYNENNKHRVVFQLHGGSGNGEKFYNISGWNDLAEEHQFLAVYPTSFAYDMKMNGCGNVLVTHWNTFNLYEEVCDANVLKNDTEFFNTMIDELISNYNIDENRIYISGFSRGAGMAGRLAIELSDRIAAMGSIAGFLPADTTYVAKRYLPIHIMLGTLDEKIVPKTSFQNEIPMDFSLIEVDPGLGPTIGTYLTSFDLNESYIESSSSGTITATFQGKSSDPDHIMKFTLLEDVPHIFPNPINEDGAADILWDFFEPFSL